MPQHRSERIPLLVATVLIVAAASTSLAAEDPPAVGHWVGELKPGPVTLTLVLHVDRGDDGELRASLESPDQGSAGIEVATIALDGRALRFESPSISARFVGTLAEDGETITGTFTQLGRAMPLSLARTDPADLPKAPEPPAELEGIWQGPIALPGGIRLRVALRVAPAGDGEGRLEAVFDSIDQGARGIPVTAIELEGGAVRFEVKAIGGSFEGTLDDDREAIEGTWKQFIVRAPLTLERVDEVAAPRRPQHPEPPFPYVVEEVAFPSPEAGITLAGTLTIPEGDGPFPAVALVTGSGPQDRDETLLGHKPFLVIADHLTRRGVAVLRFDDRGTGRSGGTFKGATTDDFADDALAAVRYLRDRPEADAGAVGLLGHSEGGLVAAIAAVEAPEKVAFLVLLAAPGVPGSEIVLRQQRLIAEAGGATEDDLDEQAGALAELIAIALEEDDPDVADERVEALAREVVAAIDEQDREALGDADAALEEAFETAAEQFRDPWFRHFLAYDPRPTLRRVACPVLALWGAKDLQVEPAQNVREVEQALAEAPTVELTVRVLDGLNHLLQHAETGAPSEYGTIEETVAPEALEQIGDWILERTGGG